MLDKIKQMDRKTVKRILFGLSFFVLAFYVGGLLTQIFKDAGSIRFNPFICLYYGMFTLTGLKNTVLSLFLFLVMEELLFIGEVLPEIRWTRSAILSIPKREPMELPVT